MKILITGVGVTGKSTFRETLVKEFSQTKGREVIGIDGDYEKLPAEFEEDTIYVIEDVHATMNTCLLPLEEYDLILYLIPSFCYHLYFWLNRVWRWFQNGYGSWDKHRGTWLGTKKPYDIKNIPLFFRLMLHDIQRRKKWINDDLKIIKTTTALTYLVHHRQNQKKKINSLRKEILEKRTI